MKRLLLATTVLILAGCSDGDPATQFAACKMEAMRLWPNEDASADNRREGEGTKRLAGVPFAVWRNHIDEYVPNCMTAHGYHQNVTPDLCSPEREFHMQAACYEKTQDWFDKQWNWFKECFLTSRRCH